MNVFFSCVSVFFLRHTFMLNYMLGMHILITLNILLEVSLQIIIITHYC
jgi:uncharacterized protein (DUF486 family)